jgi:hypothetical protein
LYLCHRDGGGEYAVFYREDESRVRPTITTICVQEERNKLVVGILHVEVKVGLIDVWLVIAQSD